MIRFSRVVMLVLLGCCSAVRYPNWEYVRIEASVPDPACVYVVQEACPGWTAVEGCYNWYKKRATTFDANTVVVTGDGLAEYFACSSDE